MTQRKGSRIAPRPIGAMDGRVHRDPARTALLNCRHTQEFRPGPSIGDEVYCQRCRDYRHVVALQSDYTLKCRGCRYGRKFGRAMFAADASARRHGESKGHTVDRYDGSTLQWTYVPGGPEQLTIDAAEDPPF